MRRGSGADVVSVLVEGLFVKVGDKSATVISVGDVDFWNPLIVPFVLLEPAARGGSTMTGLMPLLVRQQLPEIMLGLILGEYTPYI